MKIGNIEFKNNIFLAPMAGVCDKTFRDICISFGAGAVYSEMVSAKGIYYGDKKTKSLMIGNHAVPYGVQIFGSEPDIIRQVVEEASSFGDFLDINMGCPTPKIVNNGDGSALLKKPCLASKIIEAAAVSCKKPVTVKMRIGWDKAGIGAEFAKMAENSGAAAIAVHGRTRNQFYSGKADWSEIEKIVKSVNIPVIGNGDVASPELAKKMLNDTGCSAVMIGRAAEGNPFLFRQISESFRGEENIYYPTDIEKIKLAEKHAKLLSEEKGEDIGIREARKHLAWYVKGMKNSGVLKGKLFKATKYDEIKDLLEEFCNTLSK